MFPGLAEVFFPSYAAMKETMEAWEKVCHQFQFGLADILYANGE